MDQGGLSVRRGMIKNWAAIRNLLTNTHGGSLAEFAIVVPVFFALVLLILNLSLILWAQTSLHWATEKAARCASINANVGSTATGPCTSSGSTTNASVKAYAGTEYKGPSITPVFTANVAATCGKLVSATGTYSASVVFSTLSVTLKAQSCYS
jgi:Flp pilus assembly protein TadG